MTLPSFPPELSTLICVQLFQTPGSASHRKEGAPTTFATDVESDYQIAPAMKAGVVGAGDDGGDPLGDPGLELDPLLVRGR